VPGLREALELDGEAVLGACLSGAGPSIVVFTNGRAAEARSALSGIYDRLGLPSTIRVLDAHQPV
jgi:homoserine kinase